MQQHGVGTATFYEPSTGMFASLGHGITDIDTGDLITISNGELVTTNIVSVQKGEKGKPGELKGSIESSKTIGDVSKNTSFGIFGKITNKSNLKISEQEKEVATREEIKTGKAQIICEIEDGKKEHYDIALKKVSMANCITSMKELIRMDFLSIFEQTNEVEEILKQDPAKVYSKMDYKTK